MSSIDILPIDSDGFAGHVSPHTSWTVLAEQQNSYLIDVRSQAEWTFVGVPDCQAAQGKFLLLEWQTFPEMALNEKFVGDVEAAIADRAAPLFFLCRSGARSQAAARAATASGFQHCYNVAGGFEGDANAHGHRGTVNGWKIDGLPWRQA